MSTNSKLDNIIQHNNEFLNKISKLKHIKTIVDWRFFVEMVRYGWFFIVSSFLISFLPIAICLISGSIKTTGAEILMGIGLLSSFQIIFTNVGMALSITMAITIEKLKKQRNNKDIGLHNDYGIIATQFIVNFAVGIVMTGLYIGLSYLYITYNCDHPNMDLVRNEGINFIWSTSPTILLNSWFSIFIIIIFRNRGNFIASLLMFFNFALTVITACIFAFCTNLYSIGIGISINIGIIVSIIIIIITLLIKKEHHKWKNLRMNKAQFNLLLKNSYRVSFESSWRASTRGLVIVIFSIISSSENYILPLNMIMAKILWFNMNFFLPYFGTGVSNALKYYTVHKGANYSFADMKPFLVFVVLISIFNTFTSVVWTLCMPHIVNSYISNLESLKLFAINNLYDPNPTVTNSSGFIHAYDMWGHLPAPEWIIDYKDNPILIEYLKNNTDKYGHVEGLGQLYWVNLTVYGKNSNGEASIMSMFWGYNQWYDPNYKPVFCITILLIILYHIFMTTEILLTQITYLYLKKNKTFFIVILKHTLIMGFVLIFAYFTNKYLGIEAFVIPFMLFSLVTLTYTIIKFIKFYKLEKEKYYLNLNLINKNNIENNL